MQKITKMIATGAVATMAFGDGALANSSTVQKPLDPFDLYGDQIKFDVYRKGNMIGTHEVVFRRDGKAVVADSSFSVRIPFLFFNYDYDYTSSGRWENGKLVAMTASVNDDGDVVDIEVERSGVALMVKGPEGENLVPLGTFPTTHWNSDVLGSTKKINTITGNINDVTIANRGSETVPTGSTTRVATHYQYQGELKTEVWYDAQGRWVKMRFDGKDGTPIEYRCIVCGPSASSESQSISENPAGAVN